MSSESDKKGLEFIDTLFGKLNISLKVCDKDLYHIPKTGAFIVVANHTSGDFDDLILLKLFLVKRPDFKIFSNADLKKAGEYLRDGGCVGMFPSVKKSEQWGSPVLKFIKDSKVYIVPVYFTGPGFEKTSVAIRIGNPIPVRDLEGFDDIYRYGRYLREKTNALGTSLEVKEIFEPEDGKIQEIEEIIPPVAVEDLQAEIDQLEENYKLFEAGAFKVYCAPVTAIPGIIIEIGRLREETFRQVGEGTNKKIDTDDFDRYYQHLFIWDSEARKIAGAYRIGIGADIYEKYGIEGFYMNSFFTISEGFHPLIKSAIEAGRAFIVSEYQKKPLSLYYLWKGILNIMLKHPEHRYLIGQVSISNSYTDFSRSLMIEFLRKYYFDPHMANFVSPRNPFISNTGDIDTEILREGARNLHRFDKQIRDVNIGDLGMPVLVKKYLGLNGKLVAFNLDPKFNYSLDGLIVVDRNNVPTQLISALLNRV
jgi:hypothetical protein